jgi:Fe2+ transport system protein FeoA
VPLGTLAEGIEGIVVRISEEDSQILGYLGSVHLVPGSTVCVKEVAPFDGPLLVSVAGSEHAISRQVAALVFVEIAPIAG